MADEFLGSVKIIGMFLVTYVLLYAHVKDLLVNLAQPVIDPWLYNIWAFSWDHLYFGILAGGLLGGILRYQLREPRSRIEEIPYE